MGTAAPRRRKPTWTPTPTGPSTCSSAGSRTPTTSTAGRRTTRLGAHERIRVIDYDRSAA
eukprot:308253-Heterocapsa_arctica.AAC.1